MAKPAAVIQDDKRANAVFVRAVIVSMRAFLRSSACGALIAILLSACGSQHGAIPGPPPAAGAGNFSVEGYAAKFTEYALPPGTTPSDVTVGPDGAVWFANFLTQFATSITAGRITGTGAVTLVSLPSATEDGLTAPYTSGGAAIASAGGKLWTIAVEPFRMRGQLLVSIDPATAHPTLFSPGSDCCASPTPKLAVDSRGNLWLLTCSDSCTFGMLAGGTRIGDPANSYSPGGITAGPDGNMYVTATFTGLDTAGSALHEGFVFQLSPAAAVMHQFPLPPGSDPRGIAAGPDGNLWIAELGTGKIARMTTAGAFTEFPLRNEHAQPLSIVKGSDGALWFTEFAGNALGRITTGGIISEYPVPTPHSGPYGLASCPAACNNAHGRIWFSEQTGKMGKFEF
jgi:streptogramin lyase